MTPAQNAAEMIAAFSALLALAVSGADAQQSEWLVDDYPRFNEVVCSVIHNARDQDARVPPLCSHLSFMQDPNLKTAVEDEKVLFFLRLAPKVSRSASCLNVDCVILRNQGGADETKSRVGI